jgi:hypothetical protein
MLCCLCVHGRKEGDQEPLPVISTDEKLAKQSTPVSPVIAVEPISVPFWRRVSCNRRACGRRNVKVFIDAAPMDDDIIKLTKVLMLNSSGSAAQAEDAADPVKSVPEWAQDFGRFKYHALRSDPMSSTAARPHYGSRPLNTPLPELARDEKERLMQFARNVADLTAAGVRTELPLLLRFLRYRTEVVEAEALFREGVRWCEFHDVGNALEHWDLRLYEDVLAPWWICGGCLGHGRNGEPVVIERLGRCDPTWLFNNVPFDFLQRLDIVHITRTLAAIEEDAHRRWVPFEGLILIEDLDGLCWRHLQPKILKTQLKLFEGRKLLLAGCTKRILIINAPSIFVKWWSFLQSFLLYPETAAQIQVADKQSSLELLRKYLDDSRIPAYLGGQLHIDGDAECKKMLAPGGTPPPGVKELLDSLLEKEKRDNLDSAHAE